MGKRSQHVAQDSQDTQRRARASRRPRPTPAADEALLRRMREVWRNPDACLDDVQACLAPDEPMPFGGGTLRAWWRRQHRISWAGGKLIERAMAHRVARMVKARDDAA